MSNTGFAAVLKNPNFLCLWLGQVFSQLADKVFLVLAIAIVSSEFQGGDRSISLWVSAIMVAFTIPAVLFGFLAGVFVDRVPKKSVLVVTNLVRGLLVLTLPLWIWWYRGRELFDIPLGFYSLLGVVFLVSVLTQFFAPAEQSTIPLIVSENRLLSANSLYTTTMMASTIVGFAIGEPLLNLADVYLNLGGFGKDVSVGVSYILAGVVLLALRTREKRPAPRESALNVWQELREGWQFLQKSPRVRGALIQLILLFSLFAALAVLAVRMAELLPPLEADQFGYLLAMAGVGMAVGAAVIGQVGDRFAYRSLSLWGSLGIAIALAVLSVANERLWLTCGAIAAIGLFGAVVGIPMQTTIQRDTPNEMLGKVFGLQNNAINIALSLPLAVAGLAETYFGLPAVLAVLSLLTVTSGWITWYISRKKMSVTNETV